MNLRDITDAIKAGERARVREAFSALVAYPERGRIETSSPGLLIIALGRTCDDLISDDQEMPAATCDALDLPRGSTFGFGAAKAKRDKTRLSKLLIETFAA